MILLLCYRSYLTTALLDPILKEALARLTERNEGCKTDEDSWKSGEHGNIDFNKQVPQEIQ